MKMTKEANPTQPTDQSNDVIEQPSKIKRGYLQRSTKKKLLSIKHHAINAKSESTYISDIINVQSLLNIRAVNSQQRKNHNVPSVEDRIIINVCGDRYETHRSTLERYPDTLLGNRKRRKYYYDKTRNEYFFDRNRSCFEAILYYYQSHGRLRRPPYIPIDAFLEEIVFFQLGKEAIKQLKKVENIREAKKILLPKARFRRHLWATMEYPDYTPFAKVVSIVSLVMILISTLALAIESLPQYVNLDQITCDNVTTIALNNTNQTIAQNTEYICSNYLQSPFFIVQTICIGFFTLELLLRIISTPSYFKFFKSIMNWVDISAIVPYYVILGIYLADGTSSINTSTYLGLRLLRILRFTRVLKFYRIFRNIKSLRALGATVRESLPDFFIMINILTLLSFLFGSAAYFAENDSNSDAFDSIPKATYWGIITIASVGYGDIVPITPVGRVIACLCGLCGATTIGMLVSILVDRYQRVFARKLYKDNEIVDYHDLSDDDNDSESRFNSGILRRFSHSKLMEHTAAKIHTALVKHTTNTNPTTDTSAASDIEVIDGDPMNPHNKPVRFVIGYADSDEDDKSSELIQTVSSVVANKQSAGENLELSILSTERPQSNPYNIKFQLSLPSDEETDDDEELTEITEGLGAKGNVLKKFQFSPSPTSDKQFNFSEKRV